MVEMYRSESNILSIENEFLIPGIQQIASKSKLVIEKGDGAILWDISGQKYIDMFAGVGVCSIGHSHPSYIEAVSEQLKKVIVGSFSTKIRSQLFQMLAQFTPQGLNKFQLYSSGSEAVEAALRLAKSYTGRHEFIGFWGGFHGKTLGALGICGSTFKKGYGPLAPGYYTVPYAYCYRCPFHLKHPECNFLCIAFLKDTIMYQLSGKLAAIVVEAIQGTNGNIVPPRGFLSAISKVAHESNALLIVDEIITGFGKTGKFFASELEDVKPDIIIIGKGMANGLPVSGIICSETLTSALPFTSPSGSSSSYGGNPLCAAGALATIQIIVNENLIENAKNIGDFFIDKLATFYHKYPFVGKIHGKGLLIGIELVSDKKMKEPLDTIITNQIFNRLIKKGIIMMAYNAKIRINPPLCVSRELCEKTIESIDQVFSSIANDYF